MMLESLRGPSPALAGGGAWLGLRLGSGFWLGLPYLWGLREVFLWALVLVGSRCRPFLSFILVVVVISDNNIGVIS